MGRSFDPVQVQSDRFLRSSSLMNRKYFLCPFQHRSNQGRAKIANLDLEVDGKPLLLHYQVRSAGGLETTLHQGP